MQNIFDCVGISYKKRGDILRLYDNGKLTDGWICFLKTNNVKDFSKERADGNPFNFIKLKYNLDNKWVFSWFSDNYWINSCEQVRNRWSPHKKKNKAIVQPYSRKRLNK